jgi:hypothetical protein
MRSSVVEPVQLHTVRSFGHRCGCWSHCYILLLAVPEQWWLQSGLVGQHGLSTHLGRPGSSRVCNSSTVWFNHGAHPFPAVKTLTEPYHSGPDRAIRYSKLPSSCFLSSACAAIIASISINRNYVTSESSIRLAATTKAPIPPSPASTSRLYYDPSISPVLPCWRILNFPPRKP